MCYTYAFIIGWIINETSSGQFQLLRTLRELHKNIQFCGIINWQGIILHKKNSRKSALPNTVGRCSPVPVPPHIFKIFPFELSVTRRIKWILKIRTSRSCLFYTTMRIIWAAASLETLSTAPHLCNVFYHQICWQYTEELPWKILGRSVFSKEVFGIIWRLFMAV